MHHLDTVLGRLLAEGDEAGVLCDPGTVPEPVRRCRNGHWQTPDNVYVWQDRSYCRECRRSYMRLFEQGGRRPYRPTRCPVGHEYTQRNVQWEGRRRHCRTCKSERRSDHAV